MATRYTERNSSAQIGILLVLIDKIRSLLDVYFEKIMAGGLSKSLICKEPEIFCQLRSVS